MHGIKLSNIVSVLSISNDCMFPSHIVVCSFLYQFRCWLSKDVVSLLCLDLSSWFISTHCSCSSSFNSNDRREEEEKEEEEGGGGEGEEEEEEKEEEELRVFGPIQQIIIIIITIFKRPPCGLKR